MFLFYDILRVGENFASCCTLQVSEAALVPRPITTLPPKLKILPRTHDLVELLPHQPQNLKMLFIQRHPNLITFRHNNLKCAAYMLDLCLRLT